MRSAHQEANGRKPRAQVLAKFLACDSGATAIEYGLICGMIFLAIVAGVQGMAANTAALHVKIQNAMP